MGAKVTLVYSGQLSPDLAPGYYLRTHNFLNAFRKSDFVVNEISLEEGLSIVPATLRYLTFKNAGQIRKLLKGDTDNILFFGLPAAVNLAVLFRRKSANKKIVVDVCDSWVNLARLGKGRNALVRTAKKILIRFIYGLLQKQVDRFVFISRPDALAESEILNSKEKTVIPNGAPTWTQGLYFEKNFHSSTLLLVGSGDYPPNVECLNLAVKAFEKLLLSGHISIRVIGPRWKTIKITGVEYSGWVENLADAYRDCFATLALMETGTGISNKVIESLAVGRPVIASKRISDQFDESLGVFQLTGKNPISVLRKIENWVPRRELVLNYIDAWDESYKRFFNNV